MAKLFNVWLHHDICFLWVGNCSTKSYAISTYILIMVATFITDITPEDISSVVDALKNCSKETLIRFSKESLKDETNYENNWKKPNWVNVMSMLTHWVNRELSTQDSIVNKAELARKISVWSKDNVEDKDKSYFQIVARRLFSKGTSP